MKILVLKSLPISETLLDTIKKDTYLMVTTGTNRYRTTGLFKAKKDLRMKGDWKDFWETIGNKKIVKDTNISRTFYKNRIESEIEGYLIVKVE